MMGEARRTDRVAGKSDPVDATAVARAALRHPELPEATLAAIERQIGLLVAHREILAFDRAGLLEVHRPLAAGRVADTASWIPSVSGEAPRAPFSP
jgi:hypothetical protein